MRLGKYFPWLSVIELSFLVMVQLIWVEISARAKAIADIKFTYVVSCQLYGVHKTSKDSREKGLYENILNLMLT
jgi:hypothetical protein